MCVCVVCVDMCMCALEECGVGRRVFTSLPSVPGWFTWASSRVTMQESVLSLFSTTFSSLDLETGSSRYGCGHGVRVCYEMCTCMSAIQRVCKYTLEGMMACFVSDLNIDRCTCVCGILLEL